MLLVRVLIFPASDKPELAIMWNSDRTRVAREDEPTTLGGPVVKVVVHGRMDVDVLMDMSVSREIRLANAVCGRCGVCL